MSCNERHTVGKCRVRASGLSDVIKIWVWALCSVAIGVLTTPLTYNGGKALSELSATKDFSGLVNRFAVWSTTAGLESFFKICSLLAALLFLLPLLEWLRLDKTRNLKSTPLSRPIDHSRKHLLYGLYGFVTTFVCFLFIGFIMVKIGSISWAENPRTWRENFIRDIFYVFMTAACVEIFLRNVVLGTFLRQTGIHAAIAITAAMFGGISFLLAGFAHAENYNTENLSGLKLAKILIFEGEPLRRFIVVFIPWFAFGGVLVLARWKFASAFLPAGLLVGTLFAGRIFSKATDAVEGTGSYWFGNSVHNGIIPLIAVVVIGCFVHYFAKKHDLENKA